jgi:hypothetical protein
MTRKQLGISDLARYPTEHANEDLPWSEDAIQAKICSALRAAGIVHAADQNKGRRSKAEGSRRKLAGMAAGEPDLRIYLDGARLILIELKTRDGKLKKSQEVRIPLLKELGFSVHIVYGKSPVDGVNQVLAIIDAANKS